MDVALRTSGLQLDTRVLEMPRKLPQKPRPTAAPTPGSKSSESRVKSQEAQKEAFDKRCNILNELVGDCFQSDTAPLDDDPRPVGTGKGQPSDFDPDFELDHGVWPDEPDPWDDEPNFCPICI